MSGIDGIVKRRAMAAIEAQERDHRAALTAAMDRYADGDAAAFPDLYDLVAPRLEAFFLRGTRDRGRAQDLVQQTLLQLHRARQTFVRGSDAIPWIYAIGRRVLIDSHRRGKKEVFFTTDEAARLDERVSWDGDPAELAVTEEMAACARAELSRLPEPQRAAYELVRMDGLSVAEAAGVLGTTPGAVKQRLYRTYEALRCALGIDEGR
jgi:RNA polymerase sigma-70 factor (ECF subfamily)